MESFMFRLWKYSISQHSCIKHFHSISVCLAVSHLPLPLLHLSLPSSSAPSLLSTPLLTFCRDGSCKWVQLWSQSIGGHIREALIYMCDFPVKLPISPLSKNCHYHRLYPPPSEDLQESLIYLFITINFSFSTSITLNHWCPSDYKHLGRDILQNWSKGEEGRHERIEKELGGRTERGACIPLPAALSTSTFQSMHCTCATSNTPGYQPKLKGIFHVVSNFFPKLSSVTNKRTWQASHAEDLSWEAKSFRFKDLPNGIFLCSMLSDVHMTNLEYVFTAAH